MKNADENELRSIATDPDEIHMYNVNDFSFLLDVVDDLTINLCNSVKGPGKPSVMGSSVGCFHLRYEPTLRDSKILGEAGLFGLQSLREFEAKESENM